MKKYIVTLLIICMMLGTSCSSGNHSDELTALEDYIYEVSEYTDLDYQYARKYFAEHNDNWGGGCSAISKMVGDHRLIGRNMDLNISNKCAYIVRTNCGEHKTIGLAYTFRDMSPDFEKVKKEGLSDTFYKVLPFICDDVLNDAGLHVEVNMRHAEYWPNGEDKFVCEGTNPKSQERVYMFELTRYIAEHCTTVEEAKEYVSSLNVYSQNHYWNYCFIVSDANGNSSLLEFSANGVYWLDEENLDDYTWLSPYNIKAVGQTNFYLSELAWYSQDIKSGEGRFVTMQKGIDAVNSRKDMYELMKKVQYSNYYLDYDVCKNNYFDPRSENIGEVKWAQYDLLMDPQFENESRRIINSYTKDIKGLSRQEKRDANEYWESIFTEVVDTASKEIFVRIYENEDCLYKIGFDGTIKLENIEEWK